MTHQKPVTPSTPQGMPDIASNPKEDKRYLKAAAVVAVGILALWLIHTISHRPAEKATSSAPEEEYNVQETNPEHPNPPAAKQTLAIKKPPINTLTEEQKQALLALEKESQARLQAPVMLVGKDSNATQAPKKQSPITDANTQFLEQLSTHNSDTLLAENSGNRSVQLAEGTLIHGVMESAINSDLPGMIRALVAEPVYAEDASRILIAPGSRLIGQYKSGMQQGQTRIFVVWTTLIQPNGSRLQLNSPGTDNLAVAGDQADSIDYHFWERFGTSGLLSVIGAGAANVGVNSGDPFNATQAYRQAVAQSFSESAKEAYKQNGSIAPTLHIHQGKPIIVFVAHTLDFSNVIKPKALQRNVF